MNIMKRFKLFVHSFPFTLIICSGLFTACNNEIQNGENCQQEKSNQSDLATLKSFSKYVTREVYLNAYDKETGDINIEKYDQIILSYKLDKPINLSKSFEQPILTRNSNEMYAVVNSNEFTDKQKEIFNKLLTLEQPSLANYEDLKREVSSWQTDEKFLVIQVIDHIITIINGIEEGLGDVKGQQAVQTRSASAKSYICNAGVTMISAVTGFLAGALTAPTGAGGLVGYVVGGAVSVYLGANMC